MTLIQDLKDCADVSLVGGKAANLGALLRAGFAVPEGFVMTTAARDEDLKAIRHAYRDLTASEVAVRSSATIEDSADLSTAGQFKTVLNVRSEAELLDAVRLCRTSCDTPMARAYLGEGHVSDPVGMAVVVQRQIPADVAGVLFTQAPDHPDEMLIEAAPGLGEDLVSGRTQPDTYRVRADTGRIIESRQAYATATLGEAEVAKLWSLGREVALHFDAPQDIEWALSGDKLFLLQTRPITTLERAATRRALLAAAREKLANPERGPWVAHNLAETLPHPTPLTWSILRRFMSGAGGFGAIYRRLGFAPGGTEFLELILGHIYMDLSRAPALFGENFPFAYNLETLRRDPNAAQLPPSLPRGSWSARRKSRRQMSAAQQQIDEASAEFDRKLTTQIIPEFVAWCREEKKRVLTQLSNEAWIALWQERQRRVFDQFAPEIFFTSFITATALQRLRDSVAEHFWDECPETLTQLLASPETPDHTTLADAALREVAQGRQSVEVWLAQYGHRALNEFDLAAPRWREMPESLLAYAARLQDAPDPLELRKERAERARKRIAKMPPQIARELLEKAELARRYIVFRENGKHDLMFGYDLLRDMVLDASRRLKADPIWLTIDELTNALRAGNVPHGRLAQRKHDHHVEARIMLPRVIDPAELSALGEIPQLENHPRLQGLGISSGFAAGPVRVVESPLHAKELGSGYVLVCPSTDPQWTPLFLKAAALVLGCGGSLSHGAIVARELNLPAVVLPDATRLLRENEQLFVDGTSGVISRTPEKTASDPHDTLIVPAKLPPIPGQRERRAARMRNTGFVLWGMFLLGTWLLPPSWLYLPSLHLLDIFLWPIVRSLGRPVAVALIGAGLATLAALVQAFFADNARLREARRRVGALTSDTALLPLDSPRRGAVRSIDAAVQRRIIGAGFIPVGVLLGVFVLSFTWLVARVDRTNPLPGSSARVLAMFAADLHGPITLSVDPALRLDASSPRTRSLPPIRETLDRLATQISGSQLADLQRYLHRGVPPQTISWLVRADSPASYPITIAFGNQKPIHHQVVFGNHSPSPLDQTFRQNPLRSVKVEPAGRPSAFWKVGNRAITWPWIYLVSYLTAWLLLRRLFKLV